MIHKGISLGSAAILLGVALTGVRPLAAQAPDRLEPRLTN